MMISGMPETKRTVISLTIRVRITYDPAHAFSSVGYENNEILFIRLVMTAAVIMPIFREDGIDEFSSETKKKKNELPVKCT